VALLAAEEVKRSKPLLFDVHEVIEIQVSKFQRLKAYVADANGIVVAAAALVPSLAVLFGFLPKVRRFFRNDRSHKTKTKPARPTLFEQLNNDCSGSDPA
jgi:hypothetical protein